MPQYKLKPLIVKAITVQEIINNNAVTPHTHSVRIASLIASGDITFQPDNKLSIRTPKGRIVAGIGDTLVQDMIGDLSVMTTINFNAIYIQE
jgi:hypothetical protein